MKSVFETSNSLEAHMVVDLLEQQAITAQIDGEYLQGGVGELQAHGFIRVMVEDNVFEKAKQVVTEWESAQPDQNIPEINKPKLSTKGLGFIAGLTIGIASMFWAYNSPVTKEGIDYNGDGKNEEMWVYKDNRPDRTEIDQNRDGNMDFITTFSRRNLTSSTKIDGDFDGVFETTIKYREGLPYIEESDSDQDGNIDLKTYFKFGGIDQIHIFNNNSSSPIKIQKFKMGKLISAKFDSNRDGKMDTLYEYDNFEEIVTTSRIRP